jgi:ATP-binding cassette subfamily B protein
VGGVIITLFMDPKLAMAMIVLLPFIFLTVVLISKKGVPHYTRVQQSVDGMVRIVREDVQGIRVIKALSKNDYENRRYDEANRTLVKCERRAGMIMGIVNPVMTMLMNGGIVLVVALAALFVSDGSSHPETVIAFMQYFTLISTAMMSVGRMFVMYTKCAASARRIAEVLHAEEELPVCDERTYPTVETDSHIVFQNVSFSYIGRKNDLTDISFSLPHGGSLGIIGATGSGKSTMIKLLHRFYDVSRGSIYINGRDLRCIPKDELYGMMGTAMQQDFLYADTVAENIRFGRDLTQEQIEEAARIAQAHEFIMTKPDGYGYRLAQKGANLSGG